MPLSNGISLEAIVLTAAGARYSVLQYAFVRVQIVATAVVDSCQDELPLATASAAYAPPQQDPRVHGWSRNRRLQ